MRAILAATLVAAQFCVPMRACAASPGIVVANSGGKDTAQFRNWQQFRKKIDEKGDGTLLLDYLIYGELGTAQAMLQSVIDGRATIGGFGCAGVTQLIPELAIPQMPFLFSSQDEVDFVFDRYMTPIFSEILEKHGLVLLQWTDMGWMDLYTRSPIQLPAQLEGRQVRTVSNVVGPILLQSVKATPVDVAVINLDTSIQVDKLFGGLGPIQSYPRLQPNFRYVTMTRHSYDCGLVVANKAWFDSATSHEQDVMRAAYPSIYDLNRQMSDENAAILARMTEKGSVILQLTPVQHNAWAAAALPLYPAILEQAGGRSIEVYDLIRAGKQAYLRVSPAAGTRH